MRRRLGRWRPAPAGPGSAVMAPRDGGMVTAELIVVLPAIVVALLFGIDAVETAEMQMRCQDAAQIAARLSARGESTTVVLAAAHAAAPADADVRVVHVGSTVRVSVRATSGLPALGRVLPGITVSGSFAEQREPGPPP